MNKQTEARKFLVKHGLTAPQMDILKHAARKYDQLYQMPGDAGKPRALHNGAIQTYNIRTETQNALRDGGWIHYTHTVDDPEERKQLAEESERIIEKVWYMVRHTMYDHDVPAIVDEGGANLPAWKEAHCALSIAKTMEGKLYHKTWKITEAGRRVVAQFKQIVGAEEE